MILAEIDHDRLAVDVWIGGGMARHQKNSRNAFAHKRLLVRANKNSFFRKRIGR